MNLNFYSFSHPKSRLGFNTLDSTAPPDSSEISKISETLEASLLDDGFPAIVFLKRYHWKYYGHAMIFEIYYYESTGKESKLVGWSKIIQKDKRETELPNKFDELSDNFYSRFSPDFYEFLNKKYSKEKREILIKLRDINFNYELEKELNSGKNKDLYEKYQKSMLRDSSLLDLGNREYPKELDELKEKVKDYEEDSFIHSLLFVKAIFILEDFLSNEVKECITGEGKEDEVKVQILEKLKEANLIKFKSSEPKINNENFNTTLGDLFLQKANEHIESISFHNQDAANSIYKTLFEIDLNNIYKDIARDDRESKFFEDAIKKRHDIVHRNGKDKVRDDIKISPKDIEDLIKNIKDFIEAVTNKINKDLKVVHDDNLPI